MESEDDIRRSIRVALFVFFSTRSSLLDEEDPDVLGGDKMVRSRLEIDRRLLIDIGRGVACVEGGRDVDRAVGDRE